MYPLGTLKGDKWIGPEGREDVHAAFSRAAGSEGVGIYLFSLIDYAGACRPLEKDELRNVLPYLTFQWIAVLFRSPQVSSKSTAYLRFLSLPKSHALTRGELQRLAELMGEALLDRMQVESEFFPGYRHQELMNWTTHFFSFIGFGLEPRFLQVRLIPRAGDVYIALTELLEALFHSPCWFRLVPKFMPIDGCEADRCSLPVASSIKEFFQRECLLEMISWMVAAGGQDPEQHARVMRHTVTNASDELLASARNEFLRLVFPTPRVPRFSPPFAQQFITPDDMSGTFRLK